MADAFDSAWEVAKSGDFFFARKKRGKRIKADPKGVKRAVLSGHRWANTDNLREAANRARSGAFASYIPPPHRLWDGTDPWSGNENPKQRPWRAINLTRYGEDLPKNPSEVLHPVVERKVMEDMFDRDTHEAMHEALELPLRGWPDAAHEFGAIAAQTSTRLPGREHWTRSERFRRELETHPDTMGRFDLEGSRRKRRRRR